jgi:hypothetical protein
MTSVVFAAEESMTQQPAPIDVLESLLRERYSVRAFKPDPVPRAIIDRVRSAPRRGATASRGRW